jgi:hypothetical protein
MTLMGEAFNARALLLGTRLDRRCARKRGRCGR